LLLGSKRFQVITVPRKKIAQAKSGQKWHQHNHLTTFSGFSLNPDNINEIGVTESKPTYETKLNVSQHSITKTQTEIHQLLNTLISK